MLQYNGGAPSTNWSSIFKVKFIRNDEFTEPTMTEDDHYKALNKSQIENNNRVISLKAERLKEQKKFVRNL